MKNRRFIERTVMGTLSFIKENIYAEECASSKGFLQARDPRVRTLMVLLLLLSVLFSRNAAFIAGVYAACLLLAAVSSINIFQFLKRTWLFIPIFAFFIAVPALFDVFSPGDPLLTIWLYKFKLVITKQGAAGAGIFFIRVLTSVSLCVLLTLTTRHYALLKVLRIFKVPQLFIMTLGMCYRYIYLFIEIIQNTFTAIKSRTGYVASSSKGRHIVAFNMASLWNRSYNLQNQVYNAMLSRGYNGEPHTTNEFRVSAADIAWLAATFLLFTGGLWITKFFN